MKTRGLWDVVSLGLMGLALGFFALSGGVGCDGGGGGGNGNDNEPAPECTTDDDCADGEVCQDGTCVEEGPPAPDGAALYATNCAACHGADGTGGIGPDITGMTAAELTTGLESASHGEVPSLTEDEVAAIADFLAQ